MDSQEKEELLRRVDHIREFNRMYVQQIGVLTEQVFGSDLSLTEIRVMHEISCQKVTHATHLSQTLSLDTGYLSRILNKFAKNGLISKEKSLHDARQRNIALTEKGARAWEEISAEASTKIIRMLSPLSKEKQHLMVEAMNTIMDILHASDAFSFEKKVS